MATSYRVSFFLIWRTAELSYSVIWSSDTETILLTQRKLAEAFKAEWCNRLKKEKKQGGGSRAFCAGGEVFPFYFPFHYLPGESINARRIREITWPLAFPALVLLHPWVHLPLFLALALYLFSSTAPYLRHVALSVKTVFPPVFLSALPISLV